MSMDYVPFKYGKRSVGSRNNWEDLQNFYKIGNKPVIFVFGGNLTTTTKEANGYAKLIGSFFKEYSASTADIISASYEGEIADSGRNGIVLSDRAKFNAMAFFDKTLWPALNQAKSEEELKTILGKMIFVGHSAGANVIDVIMECMQNYLLFRCAEDKNKVDELMSHIQCFCYAPGDIIKQNVTVFYVSPFYDELPVWKNLLLTAKTKAKAQYPQNFLTDYNPSTDICAQAKDAINQNKFIAYYLKNGLILVTDKLSDKNDHNIINLRLDQNDKNNRGTQYTADRKNNYRIFVSSLCESILNRYFNNVLHNDTSSFHDDFNKIKQYAETNKEEEQTM